MFITETITETTMRINYCKIKSLVRGCPEKYDPKFPRIKTQNRKTE